MFEEAFQGLADHSVERERVRKAGSKCQKEDEYWCNEAFDWVEVPDRSGVRALGDQENDDGENKKPFDASETEDASCGESCGIMEEFPFRSETNDGEGEKDKEEESEIFSERKFDKPDREKSSAQEEGTEKSQETMEEITEEKIEGNKREGEEYAVTYR